MKPKDLSREEMIAIASRIGKPTTKYFGKKLQKETIKNGNQSLSIDDYMNLVIITLANMCSNQLEWLRIKFEEKTGQPLSINKIVRVYIDNLELMKNEIEKTKLKQKMN